MNRFRLYEGDTVVATRVLINVPEGAVGRVDAIAAGPVRVYLVTWLCGARTWCDPADLGLYLYNDLPAEAAYDAPKRKPFHSFL